MLGDHQHHPLRTFPPPKLRLSPSHPHSPHCPPALGLPHLPFWVCDFGGPTGWGHAALVQVHDWVITQPYALRGSSVAASDTVSEFLPPEGWINVPLRRQTRSLSSPLLTATCAVVTVLLRAWVFPTRGPPCAPWVRAGWGHFCAVLSDRPADRRRGGSGESHLALGTSRH